MQRLNRLEYKTRMMQRSEQEAILPFVPKRQEVKPAEYQQRLKEQAEAVGQLVR